MTARPSEHQLACATLTWLAEPAHPLLGALLQVLPPAEVLAAIRFGTLPAGTAGALGPAQTAGLRSPWPAGRNGFPPSIPAPTWPGTQPAASGWSAPATPAGPPTSTTWAPPARTPYGYAARPTWARMPHGR